MARGSDNYFKDVYIKAETINSLITFLLNHKKIKEHFKNDEADGKKLIEELHSISYDLYKIHFSFSVNSYLHEKTYDFIMAACSGILADRVSDVDLFIRENISEISNINKDLPLIEQVEYRVYPIILFLLKRIGSLGEQDVIKQEIFICEDILNKLQQEEMAEESVEIRNGILIGGFANLLFILKSVFKYLVSGETGDEADIYSLIKNYTFNAIKLFGNSHENLKKISNVLNYTLKRLCDHSIWNVTKRAPAHIKKFLENCAHSADNTILSFLPSQRRYIFDLMTTRQSIVINMPTSAGKTLLAEIYILFTMQSYTEIFGPDIKRPTVCYVVPTNALLNQVKRKLEKEFECLEYRVECALPYYEVDEIEEEILKRDHIDILVSTPEKLDFLIRRDHPSLERLKLVVVDEAHMISNRSRGAKLELLLAILKQRRPDVNFLLISPFIENAKEISRWLGNSERDSAHISIEWTPTKQYVGSCIDDHKKSTTELIYFPTPTNNIIEDEVKIDLGLYSKDTKKESNLPDNDRYRAKTIILLEKYFEIGNFMVLCGSPDSAGETAQLLLEYFRPKLEIKSNDLVEQVISLITLESGEDDPLIECIRYGIVYHHARLYNPIKQAVEELISSGDVKIVCATTTLAQGMNFPITSIIFTTLNLGRKRMQPDEFWNIAGRAGRTFKDSEGHIISTKQTKKEIHEFIKKRTVEVISSLSAFFEEIDEHVDFRVQLIARQPGASEFLQYLNHILRVAYDYDLDNVDAARLRNILNTSLAFREMEFKSGFLESQEKIRRFSHRYIRHMKEKDERILHSADINGLSDISYSMVYAAVNELVDDIKAELGEKYSADRIKASKIILDKKDPSGLSRIIEIITKIPEMKLYIKGEGKLQPEQIAKVVINWVDGESIRKIADEIRYKDSDRDEFLEICTQYINSRLTTFLPWGMSIYQKLTKDEGTEASNNLPSYIYYGVNSPDLVILSRLGVPRFAVGQVKTLLRKKYSDIAITVDTMLELKERIQNFHPDDYSFTVDNKIVKDIIDKSL